VPAVWFPRTQRFGPISHTPRRRVVAVSHCSQLHRRGQAHQSGKAARRGLVARPGVSKA